MYIKTGKNGEGAPSLGGFTVLEVTIAMGLMALGGLALMATGDYFLKSRLAADSRSAHTNLRNLVQIALSQKTTNCVGASCTTVNNCSKNLRANGGAPVSFAGAAGHASIKDLELEIYAGTGTVLAKSGDPSKAASAMEVNDHLRYKILLSGKYKSSTPTTVTYSGFVEIIGNRALLGRTDSLRASLPLEFTFDASNSVVDCATRPTERVIANGVNDIDSCYLAGGIPVPTSIGNLCRFTSAVPFTMPPIDTCPFGFVGNPNVACTPDQGSDSELVERIPPCPSVEAVPSGCDDGFYRSLPGVGTCTACTTPAVLNATGVTYSSTGSRTASTDCAVTKIGSCDDVGTKKNITGTACVPNGCNLTATITSFTSPTGVNLKGGSITVNYAGPSTVTASITSPTGVIAGKVHSGSNYVFSLLPQGDYTVTLKDVDASALIGSDCTATLQKTLRVGGFFPDPVLGKGSLYCNFQGYPGGTAAPACPLDPIDPADLADPDYVPYVPAHGWWETNFDSSANLRKCKYTFDCKLPNVTRVDPPPIGDGKTPACVVTITECPNTSPPSNPPPWLKISAPGDPLKCKLNITTTVSAPTTFGCPGTFKDLTAAMLSIPDVQAQVNDWTAVLQPPIQTAFKGTTTPTLPPQPKHIVCY